MINKKVYITIIIISTLSFIIIIVLLGYYFIFTARGSANIAKITFSKYAGFKNVDIERTEGSLSEKVSYENIEIRNFKGLPEGSVLKIQRIDAYLTSLSLEGLNVEIFNGRLKLPGLEQIFFYGTYKNASLDLKIYSKDMDIRYILDLFMPGKALRNISGIIDDLDICIKGSFTEPELIGEFKVGRFSRDAFSMVNAPGFFALKFKDINDALKLHGNITFKSGLIFGTRTAAIELQNSSILFSGDPKNPRLDLKGTSTVEYAKINIILKGSIDKPDLKLASQPPMSRERLLIMLATGKSWKGAEESLSQGQLSPDLAGDFIDYFFFAGSGSKLSQRFGIDLSVKYDNQTKGFGVKKTISEKIEGSYRAEQSQAKEAQPSTTHNVGGEYKVTENIFVGAEKELKQDAKSGQKDEKSQTNDKVFLKFKKEF